MAAVSCLGSGRPVGNRRSRELAACPFCTALEPTLCQLREKSAVAALVEVEQQDPAPRTSMRLHKVLAGDDTLRQRAGYRRLSTWRRSRGACSLFLVLGSSGNADELSCEPRWHAVAVNEQGYGYLAKAPSLRTPAVERLRYFARFLEHSDALIAQDAYLEFGHASFADVARAADVLPLERMRDWLSDSRIPAARKGFYGMALGLSTDAAFRRESRVLGEDHPRAGG